MNSSFITSRPDHVYIKSYFKFYLLVSSADNFCKPLGPRPGPTKCWACSGFNLYTQMLFLKEFYEKNDFDKKKKQTKKKSKNIFPGGKELNMHAQAI